MPARYFIGSRYAAHVHKGDKLSLVHLVRNDELPDGIVKEEADRLEQLGYVSSEPWDPVRHEQESAAEAEARLELQRQADADQPASGKTDAELVAWITDEKPTVDETVAAAGSDPALARRILAAEREANGGEARKGVESALEKVVEDGDGS